MYCSCIGPSSWYHCLPEHPAVPRCIYIQRDCDCSNRCTFLLCQYKLYKRQVYINVQSLPYIPVHAVLLRTNEFLQYLFMCPRLREYEISVDDQFTSRRGPEVERVYFVILELARMYSPSEALYNFLIKHETDLSCCMKAITEP